MLAKPVFFEKLSWDLHPLNSTYISLVRSRSLGPLSCKGVGGGKFSSLFMRRRQEKIVNNFWVAQSICHTPCVTFSLN